MLILGIDPVPHGSAHGWAVLEYTRGLVPAWVDGGHEPDAKLLPRVRGMRPQLGGAVVEITRENGAITTCTYIPRSGL